MAPYCQGHAGERGRRPRWGKPLLSMCPWAQSSIRRSVSPRWPSSTRTRKRKCSYLAAAGCCVRPASDASSPNSTLCVRSENTHFENQYGGDPLE